jgi:hypothetical protein
MAKPPRDPEVERAFAEIRAQTDETLDALLQAEIAEAFHELRSHAGEETDTTDECCGV